jgi:ribosomal protein L5
MQVKAYRRAHADDEDDTVFKVVDRVLTQIFGEKATHLIYRHLERNYSLRSNEIAEKIDVFAKGLEDFLNSGAYIVERRILEDLQSGCELTREPELVHADFVDQVRFLIAKA